MKTPYKCIRCNNKVVKIISKPHEPLVFKCDCGQYCTDEMFSAFVHNANKEGDTNEK